MVTGELADVWLHEGNRALQYVSDNKYAQQARQVLESTFNYEEKFRQVKEKSTVVIGQVQEKGSEFVE